MSDRVLVYDPDRSRLRKRQITKGDVLNFSVDANMWAARDGSSLSSAVWSVVDGDTVSVGADSESGNVSTAAVTGSDGGISLVKVVLTLADSQVGTIYIEFHVMDRESDKSDYGYIN